MDKICCLVAYFLTLGGKAFSYTVNSLYPGTLLKAVFCLMLQCVLIRISFLPQDLLISQKTPLRVLHR